MIETAPVELSPRSPLASVFVPSYSTRNKKRPVLMVLRGCRNPKILAAVIEAIAVYVVTLGLFTSGISGVVNEAENAPMHKDGDRPAIGADCAGSIAIMPQIPGVAFNYGEAGFVNDGDGHDEAIRVMERNLCYFVARNGNAHPTSSKESAGCARAFN